MRELKPSFLGNLISMSIRKLSSLKAPYMSTPLSRALVKCALVGTGPEGWKGEVSSVPWSRTTI